MIRTFAIGGVGANGEVREIRESSPLFLPLGGAGDAAADRVAIGRALVDLPTLLSAEGWTASCPTSRSKCPCRGDG